MEKNPWVISLMQDVDMSHNPLEYLIKKLNDQLDKEELKVLNDIIKIQMTQPGNTFITSSPTYSRSNYKYHTGMEALLGL